MYFFLFCFCRYTIFFWKRFIKVIENFLLNFSILIFNPIQNLKKSMHLEIEVKF